MRLRVLTLFASSLVLAACDQPAPSTTDAPAPVAEQGEAVVNVFSSRHYDTDLRLYDDFTEQTGIEVRLIEAGADELIERIQNEGEFSEADLLVTVDAGRLWRAEEAGVFGPLESEVLESRIPEYLRQPDGLWFGLSTRARVIIYNKAAGMPDPLSTYADLANPAHQGKVCIRSSSNIYNLSLLASMISRNGVDAAEAWARGVVANFAREPQSNDTGQIRAVASGECGIAVVNTYYLGRLAASEDPADRALAEAVGVVFPDQEGNGAHVNVSGVGLVKTSPNRENAILFLEYLTSEQAQRYFADGNQEYPAVIGVEPSPTLQAMGSFKPDTINAEELGRFQAEAVMTYDRAGWK